MKKKQSSGLLIAGALIACNVLAGYHVLGVARNVRLLSFLSGAVLCKASSPFRRRIGSASEEQSRRLHSGLERPQTVLKADSWSDWPTITGAAPNTFLRSLAEEYTTIRVNVGGDSISGGSAGEWLADQFFIGGQASLVSETNAFGTKIPEGIFHTQRRGTFDYEIPIAPGNYHIVLYFMDLEKTSVPGENVFDVFLEKNVAFKDVDIVELAGGASKPLLLEKPVVCLDGQVSLHFRSVHGRPTLSAFQLFKVGDHLAHAVAGGPYEGVDIDGDGFAQIVVDASPSHTHGVGLSLVSWEWYENFSMIGQGERTTLTCSVGTHEVTLKVVDDGGNHNAEKTTITVNAAGHPVISSLSPRTGDVSGGHEVVIRGHGFLYAEDSTVVKLSSSRHLSGISEISVADETTIVIRSMPSLQIGVPVSIVVSTPTGESNSMDYTYIDQFPIKWNRGTLLEFPVPACLVFGPDEKLYVGTTEGKILKLTLNESLDKVIEFVVSSVVARSDSTCTGPNCRIILGIAFDPMDSNETPSVYVAHSQIFHGGSTSSSGKSINGKVSIASGANLDELEDVVSNLPVSDHDHGINGLHFGDDGELYILCGGNTNAGVEGALSGSRLQKENVLSAAVLVAYVKRPDFNGSLAYDKDDDGNLVGGTGVEVFASGLRNSFDLVLHSETGKLYATDNGPNLGYGKVSVSCTEGVQDIEEEDKLVMLERHAYYGHPNRKRAEKDPRQCLWHSATEPSDSEYTAPLAILPASSNGITEFQSDHWGGQLRGNLIVSKYKGGLYRIILNGDGTALHREAQAPFEFSSDGGLDVTQGPSGILYTTKYKGGKIRFLEPMDQSSSDLTIKSVFPRRGDQTGGSVLRIYGDNLDVGEPLIVQMGGRICPVLGRSASKIQCRIPGGSDTVDVAVTSGGRRTTFRKGYRFIAGFPVESPPAPSNTIPAISPTVIANPSLAWEGFRLNCGGSSFVDTRGNLWAADGYHQGASRALRTRAAILQTKDPHLYQTARSFRRKAVGPFKYEIPVPVVGYYRLVLGFAEIARMIGRRDGKRSIRIVVEGRTKLESFAIVEASGDMFTRVKVPFGPIHVTDGKLSIEFGLVEFNPLVSTIEVYMVEPLLGAPQM